MKVVIILGGLSIRTSQVFVELFGTRERVKEPVISPTLVVPEVKVSGLNEINGCSISILKSI